MENFQHIIEMKHAVLYKHLEFVVEMLRKFKDTKFGNTWQSMYDCITSDRKIMTMEQINKLDNKLMQHKIRFQPANNQVNGRAASSTSDQRFSSADPRIRLRSPIRSPATSSSRFFGALSEDLRNDRDPRINRLLHRDSSFPSSLVSPRDRQRSEDHSRMSDASRYRSSSRDSLVDHRYHGETEHQSRSRVRRSPYNDRLSRSPRRRSKSRSDSRRERSSSRSKIFSYREEGPRGNSRSLAGGSPRRSNFGDDRRTRSPHRRHYSRSPSPRTHNTSRGKHRRRQVGSSPPKSYCSSNSSIEVPPRERSESKGSNTSFRGFPLSHEPHKHQHGSEIPAKPHPPQRNNNFHSEEGKPFANSKAPFPPRPSPEINFEKVPVVSKPKAQPKRRMSVLYPSATEPQQQSQEANTSFVNPSKKFPTRRMSCYQPNAGNTNNSLITPRFREICDLFSSKESLPSLPTSTDPESSSEAKRLRLEVQEALQAEFSHPRFEDPKLEKVNKQETSLTKNCSADKPKVLEKIIMEEPASNEPDSTSKPIKPAPTTTKFKIPKLGNSTTTAALADDVIWIDSESSETSVETVADKVKKLTKRIVPNPEVKPEELVKDLEKALGREGLLKLKSYLVSEQQPEKTETKEPEKTEVKEPEKASIEEPETKADAGPSTNAKRKLPESATKRKRMSCVVNEQEVAMKIDAKKLVVKVERIPGPLAKKSKVITSVDQVALKQSLNKPGSSKQDPQAPLLSKRDETKEKNRPSKATSAVDKAIGKKKASLSKEPAQEMSTKSEKQDNKKTQSKAAPQRRDSVSLNPSTSGSKGKVQKNTSSGAKPDKKTGSRELDRLHEQIKEFNDSYGITHLSGPRACTKIVKVKPVQSIQDEEYLKEFRIEDTCKVKVKRLNLKGETMPVKLDRSFVTKHPELGPLLDSYIDMMEDDNVYVGSSDDESGILPYVENKNKSGKSNKERGKISQPPEKPKNDDNVRQATKKKDSRKLTKMSVKSPKKSKWQRGIIRKKKTPTRTALPPNVDDDWEDMAEVSQKKLDESKVVKLWSLVKFMSSFDKKVSPQLLALSKLNIPKTSTPSVSVEISGSDRHFKCELCTVVKMVFAEKEYLLNHIRQKHKQHLWNRFCVKCDKIIESSSGTMESELDHLLTHYVDKETNFGVEEKQSDDLLETINEVGENQSKSLLETIIEVEETQSDDLLVELPEICVPNESVINQEPPEAPVKPLLKLRALPGDKLSTAPKVAPPIGSQSPQQIQSSPKPAVLAKPRISSSALALNPGINIIRPVAPKTYSKVSNISSTSHTQFKATTVTQPSTAAPSTTLLNIDLPTFIQSSSFHADTSLKLTDDLKLPPAKPVTLPLTLKQTSPTSFSIVPPEPTTSSLKATTIQNADFVSISLLRPWIGPQKGVKTSTALTEMLKSKNCLVALFKCMGSTCSFFTSDKHLFARHLNLHLQHEPADRSNFLNCAYCDHSTGDVPTLINHTIATHSYDKFQCNYCFYRAYNEFHVFGRHQTLYHKKEKKFVIHFTPLQNRKINSYLENIRKNNIPSFVPQMRCIIPDCTESFYVFDLYRKHLLSHQRKLSFMCKMCHCVLTDIEMNIEHLRTCFGFGLNQCVYCKFSADTFPVIDDHIAEKHSSELPIFCERVAATASHIHPSSAESMAIKRVSKSSEACVKLKIDNAIELLNSSQVENLGTLLEQSQTTESADNPVVIDINSSESEDEQFSQIHETKDTKTMQIQNVISLFGKPAARPADKFNSDDLDGIESFD